MGFRVARLERDDHLLTQAHYVAEQILKIIQNKLMHYLNAGYPRRRAMPMFDDIKASMQQLDKNFTLPSV